ncbi:MupA/Atu3671 family FMN-dependent luciferase-like monooxygenase [Pseudoalteromonas sp. T1lg65]|uniref:MupA/Atu3671 family FMN-dependent luciferase-like monooxygenase n=1 Tax=Pseudoalteromonas sp. T1lg65 TaxID=2077101 RepID=UPI003F7A0E2A
MNKLEIRRLITQLYQSGIVLSVVDGKLRSEAPPEAITNEIKSLIINNKEALVCYLSEQQNEINNTVRAKVTRYTEAVSEFALTPTQKQFWFVDKLNNGSAHYNLVGALRVEGTFIISVAEQAFQHVIQRHEPLRTHFNLRDEQVTQTVSDVDWNLAYYDLTSLPQEQQQSKVAELRSSEVEYQFDLQQAPLFRASFVKLTDTEGVLLCNLHHIAGDGWSVHILLSEFLQIYSDLIANRPVSLEELPLRYSDYARFVEQQADDERYQAQLSYWQTQLENLPTVHDFPLDFPRPASQQFEGAVVSAEISQEMSEALTALASKNGCSLFVLLHAAFSVLLHKYTGNNDIVVGTPFANREQAELESLIGLFINTLVLRTDCQEEMTFSEFVSQVKEVNLQAQSNSSVTFAHLLDSLKVNRDTAFPPLFQIMFSMDNTQQSDLANAEFSLIALEEQQVKTKVEITLNATPTENGIVLRCEYNSGLFKRDTVQQLLRHYVHLLSQILSQSGKTIAQLQLMSAQEQRELIQEMAGQQVAYPNAMPLQHQIDSIAKQFPERTALVFEDKLVCYAELQAQANRLAHYLRNQGVTSGTAVGIVVERSVDMVVAMLATLKAGAHYVPVDPAYPLNRINYVLEHAQVKMVLASNLTAPLLPIRHGLNVTKLHDGTFNGASLYTDSIPENDAQKPTDLAYMIYTSGSTGKPKGVMVSHQNVQNFFAALDEKFLQTAQPSRWLAVTSISFDISVLELLWNLSRGNEVVLMPDRPAPVAASTNNEALEFSLFYFAAEEAKAAGTKYDLLLGGAEFADQNDLAAVWVPERHFSNFGDQFPNPSVAAAAVAAITKNIKVRSGSVVLPLHDVIRVAEEWSMVDNLSKGRVEMSLASGWHPNDFVLMPSDYEQRHAKMNRQIEQLHQLWQGGTISRVNGVGKEIAVKVHPTPVQDTLTTWITAAGSPHTFELAGKSGANVLTHLLGQTPEALAEKIAVYREARKSVGLDPDGGKVALMLHTFMGADAEQVRNIVEQPFKKYLEHSINLLAPMAKEAGLDIENDRDTIIEMGFQRFYQSSGLFGTPEHCMSLLKAVHAIGVNEIACLIDFGIDTETVITHLPFICEVKAQFAQYVAQQQLLRQTLSREWDPQQAILSNKVTHLQCTPSFLTGWEQTAAGQQALAQLEVLCVGGEALPAAMVQRVLPILGGAMYNMYGPTETTVWSAIRQVTERDINIGGVVANTQCYVVDKHQQLVPKGVIGELVIGGDGVTQGYYQRPDLTAERFINLNFVAGSAGRSYRTGDYVRYLGRDKFQFVGRQDEQVKVNGFRIELGEIEVFLTNLALVHHAVVVVQGDNESSQLVAYVTPQPQTPKATLDATYLQQATQAALPAYMVPTHFVVMDQLPLTPNGKVDKKALPALDDTRAAIEFALPQGEVESQLAQIWMQVLDKQIEISRYDDFFQLGGHSLLAISLQGKIHKQFAIRLGMEALFTHSTLEKMAAKICSTDQQPSLPPLNPEDTPEFVQASINQQSLWLSERVNNANGLYNMVSLVHIEGDVDTDRLLKALRLVEGKHEAFRTYFTEQQGRILLHAKAQMVSDLPFFDLSTQTPEQQQRHLQHQSERMMQHKFDMYQGPLWMVELYQLNAQHYTLLLNIHHIVIDGWSKRLWLEDIQNTYTELAQHSEPAVAPKSGVQYRDFAHWQRELIDSGAIDSQLKYWQNKLTGISGFSNLPVDFTYPEKQTFVGAKQEFVIDEKLFANVKALAAEQGLSTYMLMLSVYNVLLAMETGTSDVVIGTDVSGRIHQDVEDVIGFFTNQIVLRNQLQFARSIEDNLAAIKQSTIEAFANQDVPFDHLVRKLGIPRNAKYSPLFQAKLFMDHAPNYQRAESGWNMYVEELENQPARCELTLGIIEYPEKLQAMFVYNTALFNQHTAARLAARFTAILTLLGTKKTPTLQSICDQVIEQEKQKQQRNKSELLNKSVKKIRRREAKNLA